MAGRLDGKVALITGASSGIGKATAFAFAREGAAVVVTARREAETEETARLIRDAGGRAISVATDVSSEPQVQSLIETALRTYGRLDIAVNNAGIFGAEGPVHAVPAEYWDAIVGTNLKGTWLCMKHELPAMLAQGGGSIVNMASTAGVAGWADAPLYATTKFGVIGLTKSAALQYAPAGIRINAVCPAFTMIESVDSLVTQAPAAGERLAGTIPLGRIATMEEVAEATLWLASDAASFCVGHALVLDGGQTIGLWK
ncbi:MAG: glucose 1-dehydrogenase [Chloroflexi bacterium]|nr:glucose 1-dehydrogenase [Chloroflexota bacterium]